MKVKVAINGFGRIGRLVYRSLLKRNFLDGLVDVVVVNDLVDSFNLAYLLKYDSVHGKLDNKIEAKDASTIVIDDSIELKTISLKAHPKDLPWRDYNIDIVIESTGLFTKKVDAEGHIKAGAKKVIITAPSDNDVKTIIMGVNDSSYTTENIISNASCTTNCLAPIVYVLIKEGIGIEEGLMTTIHAYTASQGIVDAPSKKAYRDGRTAALNIIPASTGAAKAIGLVIPEVAGKLTGMAFRVPVADVSVVDLTLKTTKSTSLNEINSLMKNASNTYLKGILEYTEEPLVSTDFIGNSASSIYDANACIQLNDRFFKLIAWYDNEWGYSNRIVDLLNLIATRI